MAGCRPVGKEAVAGAGVGVKNVGACGSSCDAMWVAAVDEVVPHARDGASLAPGGSSVALVDRVIGVGGAAMITVGYRDWSNVDRSVVGAVAGN